MFTIFSYPGKHGLVKFRSVIGNGGEERDSERRIASDEPAALASPETFPLDCLLDRSRPDHSRRACADRIGDDLRSDSKRPWLQSR